MALGAVAIALSSATEREHSSWKDAAQREADRYGVNNDYVKAGMEGRAHEPTTHRKSIVDWLLIVGTTTLFIVLATVAKAPTIAMNAAWAFLLTIAMFSLLLACGVALWRTTRFR